MAISLITSNGPLERKNKANFEQLINAVNDTYTKTEVDNGFVTQVPGKGLSTEDYTTAEKNKLAGIADNAVAINDSASSTTTTYSSDKINALDTDAKARANHTGTQLASTISDFASAAKTAVVDDSITDAITDKAPSQNAVFDALALKEDLSNKSTDGNLGTSDTLYPSQNAVKTYADTKIASTEKGAANGVATLDGSGTVPLSQLPSGVKDSKVVADIAARDALVAGDRFEGLRVHVLDASADASVNSGSAGYIMKSGLTNGDWAKTYESESVDVDLSDYFSKASDTLDNINEGTTNKHLTSSLKTNYDNAYSHISRTDNPHSVTKAQVGLGSVVDKDLTNVDNVQQLPLSYLDTDVALTADSDTKVASQKATKAYVDASAGSSGTNLLEKTTHRKLTAGATLGANDLKVDFDGASGQTIVLHTHSSVPSGRRHVVRINNYSANSLTVDMGASNDTVAAYESVSYKLDAVGDWSVL